MTQQWLCDRIDIRSERIIEWRKRGGIPNCHNGKMPRYFWRDAQEKKRIIDFYLEHRTDGYRRCAYMMIDEDIAYASPVTVYRNLKKAGVMRTSAARGRTARGKGFHRPSAPHRHWHTDISYVKMLISAKTTERETAIREISNNDGVINPFPAKEEINSEQISIFKSKLAHKKIKCQSIDSGSGKAGSICITEVYEPEDSEKIFSYLITTNENQSPLNNSSLLHTNLSIKREKTKYYKAGKVAERTNGIRSRIGIIYYV